MNVCAYVECGRSFDAKTHNQRYCSDECCRMATNARLMKQYYEKKARRQGHIRVCQNGCGTRLSRYNDSDECQSCTAARESENRRQLFKIMGIDDVTN